MYGALKLAMVVFAGVVTSAGAPCQAAKSAEQTYRISYPAPHSSMLSIIPRAPQGVVGEANTNLGAAAAPSNSGLRIAQRRSACPGCDMLYQQAVYQCEAFKMYGYAQYRACMMVAQQNAGRCMQACAAGMGGYGYPSGPAYPYPPGQNVPLCQQYPTNPACR